MSQIEIRRAQSSDAPAIVALWNPIIDKTAFTFTSELKTAIGIKQQIETCHREGRAYFVAVDRHGILGFCTYFQFRNGPGYARTMEHTIILGDRARGQGVGRQLMQSLFKYAHATGVHSLWAGVSAENQAGIAFHEAIGFSKVTVLSNLCAEAPTQFDLGLEKRFGHRLKLSWGPKSALATDSN